MTIKNIILLVFVAVSTFGQDSTKWNCYIKFHPIALIAIPRPSLQVGIEIKYQNRISIDLAYGQQYYFPGAKADTPAVNQFGNKFKIDLKYYFINKLSTKFRVHIGLGYSKIYERRNIQDEPYVSGFRFDHSWGRIENIHVFSINHGICFTYKKLLLEGILGVGIRYKTGKIIDSNELIDGYQYNEILPHFSAAFRIGYLLFRH